MGGGVYVVGRTGGGVFWAGAGRGCPRGAFCCRIEAAGRPGAVLY